MTPFWDWIDALPPMRIVGLMLMLYALCMGVLMIIDTWRR